MMPIIKPWTDEEIELLKKFVAKGCSALLAAAALKRSIKAVRVKARNLGIPFQSVREARKKIQDAPTQFWRHTEGPPGK